MTPLARAGAHHPQSGTRDSSRQSIRPTDDGGDGSHGRPDSPAQGYPAPHLEPRCHRGILLVTIQGIPSDLLPALAGRVVISNTRTPKRNMHCSHVGNCGLHCLSHTRFEPEACAGIPGAVQKPLNHEGPLTAVIPVFLLRPDPSAAQDFDEPLGPG